MKSYKECPSKIISTIYCLRNPLDRNRIFYVGRTTKPLKVRLRGHLCNPPNVKMKKIVAAIIDAGKKPVIQEIEKCRGYGYEREIFWIKYYSKTRILAQSPPKGTYQPGYFHRQKHASIYAFLDARRKLIQEGKI